MSAEVCVFDASAGVKWFRNEAGSEEMRAVLERHRSGEVIIAVDALFYYEVMRAASRGGHPRDPERAWQALQLAQLASVPLGEELVAAASLAAEKLGCALYDAFAPGLADVLDAPLYSADGRAHGAHPRVRLVGEGA
jgi:predicted nucleic acid-binding protein